MKAILIARVSTEEQKEAGNSLPAQVARLEKYCQNKGYTIEKTFSFDESAYKDQREEFERILDFILAQKEKLIICFDKVDRLSRNVFDKRISLLHAKALNDEIELHFVNDGQVLNSRISAVQKFQFSTSLGLAKYFSDAISDNVKRATEQKLRRGEWPSRAPYGYKNITREDKKDIIVDEYKSKIVQKAFELYATGAYSLELLCKKLKDDYGIDWKATSLDKVFNNHFYYGSMQWNGILHQHQYPSLITKELFEQVQQTKARFNKKERYKYAGKPYIYRGLFRCAECNLAITPEKHKGHVYYHCTQHKGKHGAKWLREENMTEQLGHIFKSLEMPQNIMQEIVNNLSEVHQHKIEFHSMQFDRLTKEQKEITRMMDNLYMDKLKGCITESDYDRFYQDLKGKLDDIKNRLDSLDKAQDNYYKTSVYTLALCQDAYKLFIGSEVEEKRQLIKLVLSNLKIDGEKIVYEAQKPFDVILKCSDDLLWRPQWDSNPCFRRERAVS